MYVFLYIHTYICIDIWIPIYNNLSLMDPFNLFSPFLGSNGHLSFGHSRQYVPSFDNFMYVTFGLLQLFKINIRINRRRFSLTRTSDKRETIFPSNHSRCLHTFCLIGTDSERVTTSVFPTSL